MSSAIMNELIDRNRQLLADLEAECRPGPEIADQLVKLADLYFGEDMFGEAEPLYWRALELRHQHLGPVDMLVVSSLQDLAELYEMQGQNAKAEQLYECIVAIFMDLPPTPSAEAVALIQRLRGYYESRGLRWQVGVLEELADKFRFGLVKTA